MITYNSNVNQKINLLNLSAYLTMLTTGVGGILEIPTITSRWLAFSTLIFQAVAFARLSPTTNIWQKHLYFLLQTIATTLLLYLSSASNFFLILFFIFSVEAMISMPFQVGIFWIAVFSVICITSNIICYGWQTGTTNALPFLSGYVFLGAFANMLYQTQKAREESQALLKDLQLAHAKLQEYAIKSEELAASQERLHLAREMHDTVGHYLTIASIQLEGALRLLESNPPKAESMLYNTRTHVKEALQSLRATVSTLRQPSYMDLPTSNAIQQITYNFSQSANIPVEVEIQPTLPQLTNPHHLTLLRTIQEGLTNIQRHTSAKHIWITLSLCDNQILLKIEDDGGGLKPSSKENGYGILGLKERAAQLGGTITLENVFKNGHPHGCRLTLVLPYPAEGENGRPN